MRVVKMQGGLGNQLFCLALADRARRVTGEPVAVDLAPFDADRYGHAFLLGDLAERLEIGLTRRPLVSSRPVTRLMSRMSWPGYVTDRPESDPTEAAQILQRGRYFNGYWQDETWVDPRFVAAARAYLLDKSPDTPPREAVVHVRTYKEEVRPERRATPDAAWFARCLDRLRSAGGVLPEIGLVSDDPRTAMEILGAAGEAVRPVTGGNAWSDMALLLRARTLILTNSTFGWWGGYAGVADTIFYPGKTGLFHYAAPARRFTVVA